MTAADLSANIGNVIGIMIKINLNIRDYMTGGKYGINHRGI